MFFETIDLIDRRILAVYQHMVNLSNKITGGGDEHIRLAKLARWTDSGIAIILDSLFVALRVVSGEFKNQAELQSILILHALINLGFVLFYWKVANEAIKVSESARSAQTFASNKTAYTMRRSRLVVIFLIGLVVTMISLIKHGFFGSDFIDLMEWSKILSWFYFNSLTSTLFFLGCVPPPRQKSLVTRFKEWLAKAPQPLTQPSFS